MIEKIRQALQKRETDKAREKAEKQRSLDATALLKKEADCLNQIMRELLAK